MEIKLKPFLRKKVHEWKRASRQDPDMKSLEQLGAELLGIELSACHQDARLADRILRELESYGKKDRLANYIAQMSQEERKYVSLVGILEEFRPWAH